MTEQVILALIAAASGGLGLELVKRWFSGRERDLNDEELARRDLRDELRGCRERVREIEKDRDERVRAVEIERDRYRELYEQRFRRIVMLEAQITVLGGDPTERQEA